MSDRKPGLRIEGNKRVDLKAQRARQDVATKARRAAPPAEDTRVSKAWTRQEGRDRAAVKEAGTAKRMKVLRDKDGDKLSTIDITISATRTEKRAIRCHRRGAASGSAGLRDALPVSLVGGLAPGSPPGNFAGCRISGRRWRGWVRLSDWRPASS